MKEDILFLHVPKTAGTTLRNIFYSNYSYLEEDEKYTVRTRKETNQFASLEQFRLERVKLVVGHFAYGLHDYLYRNFKYVSFIREPVERVLSSYYFSKWNVNDDFYKYINDNNIGPVEFLLSRKYPWLENGQVKLFSGVKDVSIECDDQIYNMAIANIEKDFLFIGTIENFNESLFILSKYLDWPLQKYETLNVTPQQVKNADISSMEKEKIRKLNYYDYKLYAYVQEKLLKAVSEKILRKGAIKEYEKFLLLLESNPSADEGSLLKSIYANVLKVFA